jgi:hypothetical protein
MLPGHAKRTDAGSFVSKRPTSFTVRATACVEEGEGAGAAGASDSFDPSGAMTGVGAGALGGSCRVLQEETETSARNDNPTASVRAATDDTWRS